MTKHTPGPWHVEQDHGGDFTAIGEPIAIVGGPETGEHVRFTIGRTCDFGPHGNEQTSANAHLIAAAPELLAICEKVLADFADSKAKYMPRPINQDDMIPVLRAAIAKAKGGDA